jgi:hypothetical protein
MNDPQESEIERWKFLIDGMNQYELARLYRFSPAGHPVFVSGTELNDYFNERFNKLGGMTTGVSKHIGW